MRRALALVFLASTVAATATAQTEVPPPAPRTPPPAPAPDSKPTPYLAYAGVALSAVALFIALRRRR